jgi:YD repeat-containing protein
MLELAAQNGVAFQFTQINKPGPIGSAHIADIGSAKSLSSASLPESFKSRCLPSHQPQIIFAAQPSFNVIGGPISTVNRTGGTYGVATQDANWTYSYDKEGELTEKDTRTGGSSAKWVCTFPATLPYTVARSI